MAGPDIALWTLRGIGVLWVLGAVVMIRKVWMMDRLDAMMAQLETAVRDHDPEPVDPAPDGQSQDDRETVDRGRNAWMIAGGVVLGAAGAAMAAGHRLAVPLLALLIVHQLAYFIRQRRRELSRRTQAGREDAQPAASTVRAFFFSLGVAVLAAYLYNQGRLG